MKKIILLFFLVSHVNCYIFQLTNDICYPKESKEIQCHGKYSYNCDDYVCIKNQYNCHMFSLFSELKGKQNELKFYSFVKRIKQCPEYKWSPNDVCIKDKVCLTPIVSLWFMGKTKLTECPCNEKYSYKCNISYCALNKLACDKMRKSANGIKNCFNI